MAGAAAPILDNAAFFSEDEIKRAKSLSLSRNWFQQHRIGSDGFIQLSFQIAYRLIHDDTVSVYEGKPCQLKIFSFFLIPLMSTPNTKACSTAAYQHGRTETIRPATVESNEFVETYLQNLNDLDNQTKRQEIKEKLLLALRKHNSLTKKCISGGGFDRHFFALKYFAERDGIELVNII